MPLVPNNRVNLLPVCVRILHTILSLWKDPEKNGTFKDWAFLFLIFFFFGGGGGGNICEWFNKKNPGLA